MAKQTIKVGENTVMVSSPHSSAVYVVGVLGFKYDSTGQIESIYLDSYIHEGNEFEGWEASGAVSTILTRI